MPSIKSVKEGDVIYPVTVSGGTLCAVARLPVEKIEPAYEYLIRELGNRCGALIPEDMDWREYYTTPMKPHKCHQTPFNCCSETATVGAHGSSISSTVRKMSEETKELFDSLFLHDGTDE